MTFDETNAKILALLQRDSSLTNEAIGSEVNLSPTAVIKRVKKLRDSGVIEATVAVLSLQSAGPIVAALVLCSFDPDGAATIDQFAQTLLSRPEITNAWVVTGEVDVVLLVLTRTVDEYDQRMRELQEAHPQLKERTDLCGPQTPEAEPRDPALDPHRHERRGRVNESWCICNSPEVSPFAGEISLSLPDAYSCQPS